MNPQDLINALGQFIGTETYHRYSALFRHILLTDGVKFLADEAGAYWLMDVIGSHLSSVPRDQGFVVCRYAGTPNGSGLFSLTNDIPARNTYATQSVTYSDFPLDEIVMYAARHGAGWVVMLRSEY